MFPENEEFSNQKIKSAANLENFYNDALNFYIQKPEFIKYLIYHQNIRSIHTTFNSFLATLGDSLPKIDILIFTEINCKEQDIEKYSINGYKQIAKPRAGEGRGGGILIYYRSCFKVKILSTKMSAAESLLIQVENEINILALYRPPKCDKNIFIAELEKTIDAINIQNKNDIIIIGDCNLNLLADENIIEKYENTLAEMGFENCIFSPTREEFSGGKFSSSLIDHIFHKFNKFQNLSTVVNYKISDHYSTSTILYQQTQKETKTFVDKINYKETYKMLNKINWQEAVKLNSEIDPFSQIADIIDDNKRANLERKYLFSNKTRDKTNEWITDEIKQLLLMREKYFLKCKRNKTNKKYRDDYKIIRNRVNFKIKQAKSLFYKNKLNECSGDSKETWRTLNEILGRSSTSIDDNIIRYMPQSLSLDQILHNFGLQFSDKVNELRHVCNFTASRVHVPDTISTHTLEIPPANDEVIKYIIEKLKKRKGPGIDKIEVNDVKNAGENFIKCLTKIVNLCLEEGKFPESLKCSIVRPIYKSGAHKEVANYRPISILSVMDKILERYLDIHLTEYLEKYNIIDCRQFAYQKGKGVNNLIAHLSDYINTNMSKRDHTLALFFDFSKAFDVLDHDILLNKLKKIGIRGKTLELFASYLKDRKFCVKIDGKYSKFYDLKSGVPQGSILGPKLFIIYICDLLKHLKIAKVLIFADDILILCHDKDLDVCKKKLQSESDVLNEWAHDNRLIINRKKTVGMHFCTKAMRPNSYPEIKVHSIECMHNFEINCCCENINFSSTTKYLGIIIDEDFSWAQQIKRVVKKIRSVIKEVKLAKSRLTRDALRTVYFSLAYSHMSYGIPAWGNVTLTSLENVQEKLLFTMANKNQLKANNNDVFKTWKVLPLNLAFEQIIAVLKYFDKDQCEKRVHSHKTRMASSEQLIMPKFVNKYQARTWEYIMPRIWNKMPLELKSFNTIKTAKENIKQWYLIKITERDTKNN